jgi:hypothetical protein
VLCTGSDSFQLNKSPVQAQLKGEWSKLASPDGPDATYLPPKGWFKSSYSTGACTCIEVRFDDGRVQIRDSKYLQDPTNDPATQPIVDVSMESWFPFLSDVTGSVLARRNAELAVEAGHDGTRTIRSRVTGTALVYTAQEWVAFVAGVEDGEFSPVLSTTS